MQMMCTAVFHTPIWTILLVIIYGSNNKMMKVSGFAIFLAHPDGKQFSYSYVVKL